MYDLTKATSWNALEVGGAVWGQQHLQGPCIAAAGVVLESLPIHLVLCVSRKVLAEGTVAVFYVGVCTDSEV